MDLDKHSRVAASSVELLYTVDQRGGVCVCVCVGTMKSE